MGRANYSVKGSNSTAYTFQDSEVVRIFKSIAKKITWMKYVQIFCGTAAVILLILFIIKLANPDLLDGLTLEVTLISLAVAILLPYVSSIEALGVKVGVKEQVEKLSAWANASPYYTLGAEYENAHDYNLAEKYYLKSLEECAEFWPSLFGLGNVYQDMGDDSGDPDTYSKSINYYKRTIVLDEENTWAYNNLASIYLYAPPPVYSPEKALECADKALEISPAFTNSIYYKATALNSLKQPEYQKTKDLIEPIKYSKQVRYFEHWFMYELAIANSNLRTPITEAYLKDMFILATENGAADMLTSALRHEERFSKSDRAVIEKYLDEYIDKDIK